MCDPFGCRALSEFLVEKRDTIYLQGRLKDDNFFVRDGTVYRRIWLRRRWWVVSLRGVVPHEVGHSPRRTRGVPRKVPVPTTGRRHRGRNRGGNVFGGPSRGSHS